MKEPLVIAFSGGRTSAMMTKYLIDNLSNKYDFKVLFANTGHERQATLDFVKKCDDVFGFNTIWVEAVTNQINGKGVKSKVVNYETAYTNLKKNGIDPFESAISKHGISNKNTPICSREMKTYTIRAYMREFEGFKKIEYKTALGIRSDEPKRLNWNKAKKEKLLYFAEIGKITKGDVNKFWSEQLFDLEIKSYEGNCILCFKKSDRKLFTIIQEGILANDPELLAEIEWFKLMQERYGDYIPESRQKQPKNKVNFFRKDRTIQEMIEESFLLDTYEFAKDENHIIDMAKQMSLWNTELDGNDGCVDSCEAF